MMKIAVIGSKGLPAKYGGTQVVVENIYKRLVKKGWSVTVYSRYYYSEANKVNFIYEGINVVNIKGIKTKRLDTFSHCLISTIKASRKDYEIVVFHGFIPALFAFIPKIYGKKTIMHSHGISFLISEKLIMKWSLYDRVFLNFLRNLTGRFIDAITSVSISELSLTKKIYSISNVEYIPNGIEFSAPVKSFRKELPEFYFLYVGRILEGKGVETMLNAFNKFNIVHKEFKLIVIGENCTTKEYFNYLHNYSTVNSNIIFVGGMYGEDLKCYYSNAFAVIVPSVYESFSLVLFEALYYNGKVICSDIDQFVMTVNDFVLFFKTGDEYDLMKKMIKIVEDRSFLNKLVEKSNRFDFSSYSWDNISDMYHKFYLKFLT